MDYEQKYKEALGWMKSLYNITDAVYKELLTALRQKIDAILEGGQHE